VQTRSELRKTGGPPGDASTGPFSEIPLFFGVAAQLLEPLAKSVRAFDAGDQLIGPNDPPRHILVILSGEVDVRVGAVHLVTRKRNEVVGEQAFINRVPHSAECIAHTTVQAISISADVFSQLLSDPAFVHNLLAALSDKLRESTHERYRRFGWEQLLAAEFRSHVSREVRDALLNEGVEYGKPRHVDATVLIADICDFTPIVANMDPLQLAHDLSSYFSDAVDLIHRSGGFVDKFVGDAIMAFWGYPGMPGADADSILRCAENLVRLSRGHNLGGTPLTIGIGINHGTVFMGNVGSDDKRQFTVLGPAVNLTARLQSKSRDLRHDVVVGEAYARRLSPTRRDVLAIHPEEPIKGAETQCVYGLNIGGNS